MINFQRAEISSILDGNQFTIWPSFSFWRYDIIIYAKKYFLEEKNSYCRISLCVSTQYQEIGGRANRSRTGIQMDFVQSHCWGDLYCQKCAALCPQHTFDIYISSLKAQKTNPGICLAITFISIFIRVAQFNEIVDKKSMCSFPEIFTRPTFTGYGADPSFFCIPICFEFQF